MFRQNTYKHNDYAYYQWQWTQYLINKNGWIPSLQTKKSYNTILRYNIQWIYQGYNKHIPKTYHNYQVKRVSISLYVLNNYFN